MFFVVKQVSFTQFIAKCFKNITEIQKEHKIFQ